MLFPKADSFLLTTEYGKALYQEHAAYCPLVDFHTHLPPKAFCENAPFSDITELWVGADPYKWRAMRMHGLPEAVITGDAPAEDKFDAWADTLQSLVGNPLYEWSQLELKRFFDVDERLTRANAASIREHCNRRLRKSCLTPQSLLAETGVEAFVTSDAWFDSLEYHRQAREQGLKPVMQPSLRADEALAVDSPHFCKWLEQTSQLSVASIHNLESFLSLLSARLDAFEEAGCVLSDHGIDLLAYSPCSESEADVCFDRLLQEKQLNGNDSIRLKTFLLIWLAGEYRRRNWTMQLHIGAKRQTSSRLAREVYQPGGYATIRSTMDDSALVSLLDAMESGPGLPRTILYSLNANDYAWMAGLSGAFVENGVPGKVQLGPAWWYNDHRDGIEKQLHAVASYGMLAHSVGMNTDSRSFLSSIRHDYFRRVLCNLMGEWMETEQIDRDIHAYGDVIQAICHRNARTLLNL